MGPPPRNTGEDVASAEEPAEDDEDALSAEELARAESRADWRASPERRQLFRVGYLWLALVILVAIAAFLLARWLLDASDRYAALYSATAVGLMALAGLYGGLFYRLHMRTVWRDRRLVDEARADLKQAEESMSDGDAGTGDAQLSLSALWTVTQARLDLYHRIATGQAARSFQYLQIAAAAGLLVILGCAIASAAAGTTAGSISVALLGAAGGGLAGYIGSTFMRSQETASAQLRAYFLQPLEFSKMLQGERLLKEIEDPTARSAAAASLIKALGERPVASGKAEEPK